MKKTAEDLVISLRLRLEEAERKLDALRTELAEREVLCRLGEVADVAVHEFSNLLNAILLQTAVLQLKVPAPVRSELDSVRAQGRIAVDLMRQLQQYRSDRRPEASAIDLNPIVRTSATQRGPAVLLDLSAGLPPVLATFVDLKLLVDLLIGGAIAVTPAGGRVRVRTTQGDTVVFLHVEDGGPPLTPEMLPHLFDPTEPGRDGVSPLELAVCKTLGRRLSAPLQTENRDDGVTFVVELKTARSSVV